MTSISQPDLQQIVDDIAGQFTMETERGAVADYIPELAKVDINQFGMAIAPINGDLVQAGDASARFSIQSISKVFTLTLALKNVGVNLWSRVGREPSGDPFNSIIQLEYERGIPRNPFINAGAIVVADVILADRTPEEAIAEIVGFMRSLAHDDTVEVDADVAQSEARTGFRNFALGNFMRAEGNLVHPVDQVLEVYFNQCAIAMDCCQLARAGCYLADAGNNGEDENSVITPARARRINALMLTCGNYDASGEFAFRVGIPGKSGVGGGILGIIPGVAAVAAWCPGLDEKGNSVLAARAFESLVRRTGWSVFGPLPVGPD